ncbi:helix-turn-helix transcriptional regulator [Streptacidiphilus albus]|uniref:helix-turn-helix transcriptional regulator n=1 Tax=Streptacidiphilus albus TaxID=105425 RepID=UPI00054C7323|nr:helix-turn-helix transcriptional regulator [Streptacidiphilus albus]
MDDTIRHPLTYARRQEGWSQDDLALRVRRAAVLRGRRSGTDRQRVWKWETRRAVPDAESQLLLADAFGVLEQEVERFGWPGWLPGRETPLPLGSAYTIKALREAHRTVLDRRAFVAYTGAAVVGLASQWATLEPDRLRGALDGRNVDTTLVDWLEQTSADLSAMPTEQRQHTAQLLDAHLATVTDLIEGRRYDKATEIRLHRLAATLGITNGWYRFDQQQHASASRLWDAALRSAHDSGSVDLGAGIVSDFAYQATWLGSPQTAADLLGHALSRARHPTARSLLHLRQARAYAALGQQSACYRSLRGSERELERPSSDEAPAWCSWMSEADLAVDHGGCLMDLGRFEEAHERISEGVALLPSARDKTKSVFLVYQARGLLQRGEVDEALSVTAESWDLANRIGAQRCLTLVHDLAPRFHKFRQLAEVRDLLERVGANAA